MAKSASYFLIAMLAAGLAPSAALIAGSTSSELSVQSLQARLKSIYKTLPQNAAGLPEAAAVRYMARRYLSSEQGLLMKGLDLVPVHRGLNATERAAHRAAQLLRVPRGLAQEDHEAITAVLAHDPARGFTLREAAQFVHALEQLLADANMRVMRKAHSLSKLIRDGNSPQLHTVLEHWATLYIGGAELQDVFDRDMSQEEVKKLLTKEVVSLRGEFRSDNDGEPLETAVRAAARDAWSREHGNNAVRAMQKLRERFSQRQAGECRIYREALSALDKHGSGQVRYAEAYGTRMNDWALLETPEYLRAVGALDEAGKRRDDPGIVIPNYVLGMNSCREPGPLQTALCCPDECEMSILPLVEAAAGGPRATPRQVWTAASQALRGDRQLTASAKSSLKSRLRALAARSRDGRLAVHGRPLGLWLHEAFPLVCPKPLRRTSVEVVDPALTTSAWISDGKLLSLDVQEAKVVKAHLQTRWGADGTGRDIRSFAARSTLGLDKEIELIHKFYKAQKQGGPKVSVALESVLKVWIMDGEVEERVLHLFALLTAAGALALLHGALAVAERVGLLVLPGRLARAVASAIEQLTASVRAAFVALRAACACAAGSLWAALSVPPSACSRAFAAMGAGGARRLSCLWATCAETSSAFAASLCDVLGEAGSLACHASEELSDVASALIVGHRGERLRVLAWVGACVVGGLLTITIDVATGIGKDHDSAMELVMMLTMLVFAVTVDRITCAIWPQLQAGKPARAVRVKFAEGHEELELTSSSPSAARPERAYDRTELLRRRAAAGSRRGPSSGLSVRPCADLPQQAAAPWAEEQPLRAAVRQRRPEAKAEPVAAIATEGAPPPSGGLSCKEKLLLEVLREESQRAPEGLSAKSRLLLDVLCESRSGGLHEAIVSGPPGLAPPPGLEPPPGLAVC